MGKLFIGFLLGVFTVIYFNSRPHFKPYKPRFHGTAPAIKVRTEVKEPSLDQLEELGFDVKRADTDLAAR